MTAVCVYAPVNRKENKAFWKWFQTLKSKGPLLVLEDMNCVLCKKTENFAVSKTAQQGTPAFVKPIEVMVLLGQIQV
ncbi:hypothetical protein DSO57_1006753 [Entomophthora muscae]|uniref:Uncharacterized protein n=1 Tax=Entomophthora muscae TaxID=34485 RepID=A0ACC2RMC0_9FUNG|nr:hypothetical protein DSO57_1006753 [Entomophthora muscae]